MSRASPEATGASRSLGKTSYAAIVLTSLLHYITSNSQISKIMQLISDIVGSSTQIFCHWYNIAFLLNVHFSVLQIQRHTLEGFITRQKRIQVTPEIERLGCLSGWFKFGISLNSF